MSTRTLSTLHVDDDMAELRASDRARIRELAETYAPFWSQFDGSGWCHAASHPPARRCFDIRSMLGAIGWAGLLLVALTMRAWHAVRAWHTLASKRKRKRRRSPRALSNDPTPNHAAHGVQDPAAPLPSPSTPVKTGGDGGENKHEIELGTSEHGAEIIVQVHHYFEYDRLRRDVHLRAKMDEFGWVSLDIVLGFSRMLMLRADVFNMRVLLRRSMVVEIDKTGTKIRSVHWRSLV